MRAAPSPRPARDARARGVPARPRPGGEHDTYARLSQLARESQRLLAERALCERRLTRITARLAELDAQSQRLRRYLSPARRVAPPPAPTRASEQHVPTRASEQHAPARAGEQQPTAAPRTAGNGVG